jgi:hypothetical protein
VGEEEGEEEGEEGRMRGECGGMRGHTWIQAITDTNTFSSVGSSLWLNSSREDWEACLGEGETEEGSRKRSYTT